MYEFTLLKSMFFELDKYKIESVTQTQEGQRTFHRLEVSYDSVPEVTSITAEERILPYVDRYYLFINDERVETDIRDPKVKQVIYEFYKQYHPEYLKEDLPDDMTDVDILECFDVFKMPDYRPEHAFPGLVTLEDLKNGNVHDEDKPKFAFPGLELYSKGDASDEDKPMVASFKGYTSFDGDREQAKDKIEQLKSQFASQIDALNVDEILKNCSENQEEQKMYREVSKLILYRDLG